jgi:hypothetical protein
MNAAMNDDNGQRATAFGWRNIRPTVRWGLLVAWLGWIACAIAFLLILFFDVESVLVTGPIIALLGLLAIFLGIAGGCLPIILLGAADCAICLLFFGLVLLLGWSPGDAYLPFASMGLLYTAGTLPLVLRSTRRAPTTADPRTCAHCGYLLYGLREPRCPECGTPFNPSLRERRAASGDEVPVPDARAGDDA